MNPEIQRFDEAVAELTGAGQPFALDNVEINGATYRNFATLPANLGAYFKIMEAHADKDFAVYLDERYTFGEGYQHSAAFAAALVERSSR